MDKNYRLRKRFPDDTFRKLLDYGMMAPASIAARSSCTEFTPVSDMPRPHGSHDFDRIFVSAAEQAGLLEFRGRDDTADREFRWTRREELTHEEKVLLFKKIIELTH